MSGEHRLKLFNLESGKGLNVVKTKFTYMSLNTAGNGKPDVYKYTVCVNMHL